MKPMLAKKWDGTDPTGWYMSEKLDGVRAIWDGEKLMSRNEKEFVAPEWFTRDMTPWYFDGELWMGRGRFNETSGQVRRKTNQDWSEMKYVIIDYPEGGYTFRQHLCGFSALVLPNHVQLLVQTKCKSMQHLLIFESRVIKSGGEGVMLRHPDSRYEMGKRSNFLLKVKRFHDDEAVVAGYKGGEGKYKKIVGSLICVYKGKEICIGTGLTDYDRACPPKVGETITFKYFEMSKDNIPRFPVYVGVRCD